MAAKVMAMPEKATATPEPDSRAVQASIRPKPIADLIAQRSAKRNTIASPNLESRLASTQGEGSPLPDDVRAFMEPRFGADFGSVRVHTDSSAVQMNQELGAKAFAVGNRIYYGAGKSPAKDELTAHELTHTIQQGAAQPKRISGQAKPNVQHKLTVATKEIGTKKLISTKAESPDRVKQNARNTSQAQVEETKEKIRQLLSSAGDLVNLIAKNPGDFLKNLINGLQLGFNNFASNIRNHLQNALISWLTGSLGSIQMPPPNTPRAKAIFSLVLQVLGINGETIRSRAVAKYRGAAKVQAIANSVAIFRAVQSRPMEMWNTVHRIIGGEQSKIIEDIKNTVITVVIAKVVELFLSVLSGVGGIQALFKIYNILKFFIERCHQMMEFVKAVIDAVRAIAVGKVDGIASSVERALGRSLPVLIGTVAVTLGIESVATRIRNIIGRMRDKVDSGIDYFLQEVGRLFQSRSQSNANRRQTPSRSQSNGNRRQTSSGGQGNGNRRQIIVPEQSKRFEMYGRSHTLYMYLRNGKCGVDIASRREYFENVIKRVIGILQDKHGSGSRTEPLPALRNFLKQLENFQYEINMAAGRASTQAEVINEMHERLDKMADQLKKMGNRYQIADLQQFRYESIYSSGGELRLEYRSVIRRTFYRGFNDASKNNKKRLLARAKAIARSKPGYNNIPAADRQYIYWCEDRSSPPLWTGHLADERKKNENPELDHIETVSHHWATQGHNQTQAQRQAWFNNTDNHQVICGHHNSSKSGERITNFNVGPNFREPDE